MCDGMGVNVIVYYNFIPPTGAFSPDDESSAPLFFACPANLLHLEDV